MQNDFTKINDDFSVNMTEAYNILVNYKTYYKSSTILVDTSEVVSFANVGGFKGRSNSYKSSIGGVESKV